MDFDFGQIMGKNILITGGCGFLGSNLAKRLVELGANVTLFIRPGKERENVKSFENKLNFIEGNLTNELDVKIAAINKDYIFHLAWQTDLKKSMIQPREDLMTDVVGLLNLLEISKKDNPNVKIIFASTTTVVGNVTELPSNESVMPNPQSVYDLDKFFAELYLKMYYKQHKIKTVTLRVSNIFGELQKIDNPNRGILNFMIGRAIRGEVLTVHGIGDFIRDYCHVQNYVDAFILAALSEKTNGESYVLGSGEGRTFNEVVEKIKKIIEQLTNKNVIIEHISFPSGELEINKRNFFADYGKFRRDTGWFPKISFDEGLKRTIEFYVRK